MRRGHLVRAKARLFFLQTPMLITTTTTAVITAITTAAATIATIATTTVTTGSYCYLLWILNKAQLR